MRKLIFGAIATLVISTSAFANGTTSTPVENTITTSVSSTVRDLDANIVIDATAMRRVCIITIKTYKGGQLVSTQVIPVDVSDDLATAQAQCQALKAAFTIAANLD